MSGFLGDRVASNTPRATDTRFLYTLHILHCQFDRVDRGFARHKHHFTSRLDIVHADAAVGKTHHIAYPYGSLL
jgi:hypothetical protein